MIKGVEMLGKSLFIACVIVANSVHAEIPEQLNVTWKHFQECIKKNDIDGVAKLTHFPIRSNEFGGDIKTPVELKNKYSEIFTPFVVRKIMTSIPEKVGTYRGFVVDCINPDGYAIFLGFEKKGKNYYFSYIDNANE